MLCMSHARGRGIGGFAFVAAQVKYSRLQSGFPEAIYLILALLAKQCNIYCVCHNVCDIHDRSSK